MKTIQVQALSKEAFAPYGAYTNLLCPEGLALGIFYPDRLLMPVAGGLPVAFSPLVAHKPASYTVTTAEYHNTTCECILPIDGDVIVHVAPPSNQAVPHLTEAFLVSKGTMVRLDVGVWHLAPLALEADCHVLIVLLQRTYMNDCVVVEYDECDYINIEA